MSLPGRKGKVLIHILSSGSWGGPERYALDICRHFRSEDWKVRVVTRDTKDVDSRFAEAGISLRHAPLRDYPDIFSALMLRPMLRKIPLGEGIVHVHSYHDALTVIIARKLARRPDIRLVATRHKASKCRDSWLRRFVYRSIDCHIFVSEFAKSRFLAAWPDGHVPVAPERMKVIFNSLLTPDGEPAPEPARGPVVAMYRGRLKPGRGLETLIDALSLLRDLKLRLRIAGTGAPDYVDALRRRAERRGVMERIDWVRRADDASRLIAESHFGVFPSVEPEAFGMTNLEFMVAKRPQISTLTGGQKEFLTAGMDVLEVNPADASSLAEAMRSLASDPELRRRLGDAAYDRYRRCLSWPHFVSSLKNVYLNE